MVDTAVEQPSAMLEVSCEAVQPLAQDEIRTALGLGIQRRASETAEMVLELSRKGWKGLSEQVVERGESAVMRTCELATRVIGRWVATGEGASAQESTTLAETGAMAAEGLFPIVTVTSSYIAWRDCATAVLREEAELVGAGRSLVDEITRVIGASSDASLVTMVRRFDAHYRELKDQLAEEHAKLSHLAMHDPLTGLVNRTQFLDRLEHSLAAATRTETEVAVFFLDLDSFKAVNDELGHDAGDRLLQAVAKRLLARVRPGDTVARFGGDEFVILCPNLATADAANTIRNRLRRSLSEPFAVPGQLEVGVSIGMALATRGVLPADILAAADAEMYADKARRGAER